MLPLSECQKIRQKIKWFYKVQLTSSEFLLDEFIADNGQRAIAEWMDDTLAVHVLEAFIVRMNGDGCVS